MDVRKFKTNKWKHGNFKIIKGEVIEKGGVAFSNVSGKFSKEYAKKISPLPIKYENELETIYLTVNTSILRQTNDNLFEAFKSALSKSRKFL